MSSAALSLTYPHPVQPLRPVPPQTRPKHSPPHHLRALEPPTIEPNAFEPNTVAKIDEGRHKDPLTRPRSTPAIFAVDLPPLPFKLIGKLAVFAYEAVEGTRNVGQLGNWISVTVAKELSEYRALTVERKSLYRDTRRVVPTVQRVRVTQPMPGIAEAAVVLNTANRAKAVALRFEGVRGHWQATSITVL